MMFHIRLRLFVLLCFILLLCGSCFSKPSSFLEKIRSLHRSDASKTRMRRDLENSQLPNETSGLNEVWNRNNIYEQLYHGPVCELIEARHDPELLKALENCTMVDGNVIITFINDNSYNTKYNLSSYSFPKLRVITEHLLIYRVYGLKTLRNLFPNLVMIGGQKLFSRYALVIFENPDLIDVGLDNLKYIKRGGVRIENNGDLCYLGTVDWALLGKIPNKTKHNEIVAKPKLYNNNLDSCIDQCSSNCRFRNSDGVLEKRCWGLGKDSCQKGPCPSECPEACTEDRQCTCHRECLGGCTSPRNASACLVCRNKFFNNTCVSKCPKGTLLSVSKWHCVTIEYCESLQSISHGGECLMKCPAHHKQAVVNNQSVCQKCNGSCSKECVIPPPHSYTIDNERSLDRYMRCTVIRGQLIFSLSVADMRERLEEAFEELEEVGSLVIRRSYYLTSLSFFKSLKRITGEKEYLMSAGDNKEEGYSLYVLDNKRLKSLWNMGPKVNFTIGGGKAFFHFNPYLCLDKINKTANLTKAKEDSKDISQTTNGDRITCNMDKIEDVNVTSSYSGSPFVSQGDNSVTVKISWKTPEIQDFRTLIGYNIYYGKKDDLPKLEEDLYEESSWNVDYLNKDDLSIGDRSDKNKSNYTSIFLHTLMPYTEYMFYIATYTTARANKGAKSDIISFQTRPTKPSYPRSVSLLALNESAMQVQWEEPRYMNGKIDHYIVKYQSRNYDEELFLRTDVCVDQTSLHFKDPVTSEEEVSVSSNSNSKILRATEYLSTRHVTGTYSISECQILRSKYNDPITSQSELVVSLSDSQSERYRLPKTLRNTTAAKTTESAMDGSCGNTDRGKLERDVMDSVQFEDFLINELITQNNADWESDVSVDETVSRKKRSIDTLTKRYRRFTSAITATTAQVTVAPALNRTDDDDLGGNLPFFPFWDRPIVDQENKTVNGSSTKTTIINLVHFMEYEVSVQACNHAYGEVGCSKPQVAVRRTKKREGADDINSTVTVEQMTKLPNQYLVKFAPPAKPNSLILLYTIRLTSDNGEVQTKNICCSNFEYQKHNACVIDGRTFSPGTYRGRVQPLSLAAPGALSEDEFKITIQAPPTKNVVLQGVLSSLSAVLVLVIIVGCIVAKKRLNSKQPPIYASVNPEYSSVCMYELDEYEIDEDDIKLLREIGQGHFGKVYEGVAQKVVYGQSETRVAIKTGHGGESVSKRMDFLKEASVMKAFNSHHVVRLLGVVSKSVKPMMVMEFMCNGDLKSFLRSIRPDAENRREEQLTLQQKLQMCGEIADGMAYLADSKYVHRDLAARNCLVHEDMTVKISDFGLTRDVYETDYYRIGSRGILPVRWMAPESLKDGVFDSRSDVWSYGVVLWEIATLAEQPYQGRQHDEVTRFVIDGGYMEQPRDCPKKIYDLMLMCWHYSPSMRPDFLEIVSYLLPDLSDRFKELSFYGEQKEYGDQKEVVDHDADDIPYMNGSELSTEVLLHNNGTFTERDMPNNFRHMNGGRQAATPPDREDVISNKDDDPRYVPHPIQTHRNTTSC